MYSSLVNTDIKWYPFFHVVMLLGLSIKIRFSLYKHIVIMKLDSRFEQQIVRLNAL